MEIDKAAIEALADVLEAKGLTEIEVREGDASLRVVARMQGGALTGPMTFAPAHTTGSILPPAPFVETGGTAPAPMGAILSPMVGTAYLQSEPGVPPFVKRGDHVAVGDTLVIIEAMKVMNPIRAERAGTVSDILVKDGQPVEFGQPLIVLT